MKNPTLKKIWATYHAERADAMTTVEALAEHMKSGSIYPVRCVQPGNPTSVILAGKTNPFKADVFDFRDEDAKPVDIREWEQPVTFPVDTLRLSGATIATDDLFVVDPAKDFDFDETRMTWTVQLYPAKDADRIFGTYFETEENDSYMNIYAEVDMWCRKMILPELHCSLWIGDDCIDAVRPLSEDEQGVILELIQNAFDEARCWRNIRDWSFEQAFSLKAAVWSLMESESDATPAQMAGLVEMLSQVCRCEDEPRFTMYDYADALVHWDEELDWQKLLGQSYDDFAIAVIAAAAEKREVYSYDAPALKDEKGMRILEECARKEETV